MSRPHVCSAALRDQETFQYERRSFQDLLIKPKPFRGVAGALLLPRSISYSIGMETRMVMLSSSDALILT